MRALTLQFAAPLELRIVETDVPEPRAGEVLVRTLYSGISSGTELLAYRGEVPDDLVLDETIGSLGGTFSYPFAYGYSCVGVVEGGSTLSPGTLVFALHPHQDRFVCPVVGAIPITGVDPRAATLFPLVETSFQITLDAGRVLDENIIIVGLGAIGILTSLLLQRAGAHVIAVEPSEWRRGLAAELEIESVDPAEVADRVREITAGNGVPLVIEASGNPTALASSLELLAHEGTALVASWYGTKPATLLLGRAFHRRRLTIRSTQVSTIPTELAGRWTLARRRTHVAGLLRDLPLKRLATHEFSFSQAADAFARLDRGQEDLIHAALVYGTD